MLKYFEPSKLEQWRGRSIYEFLGVRFFKKYLLPTERLIVRLRGPKAMRGGREALRTELMQLEWETRRNEIIHWLAMLLTGCLVVFRIPQSGFSPLSAVQLLLLFTINLYVNVYPIFVQRYNRFRLMRLLGEYKP